MTSDRASGGGTTGAAEIARWAQHFRWDRRGEGTRSGAARGRRLGVAGEFEGYRAYAPGDPLRQLDPKVYARLRQRVVRVQREDSALPVTLLIDRSASMGGAASERCVAELATFFVAVAQRHGDPLRAFTFQDGNVRAIVADLEVGARLTAAPAAGESRFGPTFRSLPAHPAGRGIVIVLSDAWGIEDADHDLAPLPRVGVPFWIAPNESVDREPPVWGAVSLTSREREPEWRGHVSATTVAEYRQQRSRYHEALARRLRGSGGDFIAIRAEESLLTHLNAIVSRGRLLAAVR